MLFSAVILLYWTAKLIFARAGMPSGNCSDHLEKKKTNVDLCRV